MERKHTSRAKRIHIPLSALLLVPTFVYAQQVTLPPVDPAASSFRNGIGEPGLMLQERIQNSDVQYSESWLFMNQASYITRRKILGGYYGFEALLPVLKLNAIAGVRLEQAGAGDLIISPFQLEWVNQRLFDRTYFDRLNLSFTVLTGQYSKYSTVNIGNNVLSSIPTMPSLCLSRRNWRPVGDSTTCGSRGTMTPPSVQGQ